MPAHISPFMPPTPVRCVTTQTTPAGRSTACPPTWPRLKPRAAAKNSEASNPDPHPKINPLTFPDGYYAAADPDNPETITCWRRSSAKSDLFAPWKRGARYGPYAGITRADVPKDQAERQVFFAGLSQQYDGWFQQVCATIAADLNAARLLFAGFSGKCSSCGRKLTDPKSKLLGIGPDCRGER